MDDDAGDGLSHLIEHIQDAVVAFELDDREPIIRDCNESFLEVFGYEREALVGAPLNDYIVPEWLQGEAETLDRRIDAGEVNYRQVRRQTAGGLREFLYRGVPYDGRTLDGYAVYTDLTAISRKQRQVDVLNRVLRHNLRNEATVISGSVERLAEEVAVDETGRSLINATRDSAETLRTLATEAGDINRLLDSSAPEPEGIDIVPIIAAEVDAAREMAPSATIEADLPQSLTVSASPEIDAAIEALLENAIVHNPAEEPWVRVTTEPVVDCEWVDVAIEDDGPTIPESERTVITGEAEITPTQHASGLGLWLAKFTVEEFGGEISFGESPAGGNSVRLRLQRR